VETRGAAGFAKLGPTTQALVASEAASATADWRREAINDHPEFCGAGAATLSTFRSQTIYYRKVAAA